MKKMFAVLAAASALCISACGTSPYESDWSFNATPLEYEPSIEKGLEIISMALEGRILIQYIVDNPVSITFQDIPGIHAKYEPLTNRITLPQQLRGRYMLAGLAMARAIAVYQATKEAGATEIFAEAEVIGALMQVKVASELGSLGPDITGSVEWQTYFLDDFCAYINKNQDKFAEQVMRDALDPDVQKTDPCNDSEKELAFSQKALASIDTGQFPQVMNARSMEKADKGLIPLGDAVRLNAELTAMTPSEINRKYGPFMRRQIRVIKKLRKNYERTMEEFALWRAENSAFISRILMEIPYCRTYQMVKPTTTAS